MWKSISILLASTLLASASEPLPQEIVAYQQTPSDATGADLGKISYEITIHVSPDGNDQYDGLSAQSPVASLARAGALAQDQLSEGMATRLLLSPGVYREAFPDFGKGDTPLSIEGVTTDGEVDVVISGSDLWPANWHPVEVNGTTAYRHDWPHNFYRFRAWRDKGPKYEPESAVANYRQVFFINGELQRQVLSKAELAPGKYYVDEGAPFETDGFIISIPPSNVDFEASVKEVAVRGGGENLQKEKHKVHKDWEPTWPPDYLLSITDRQNVSFKNIRLEHGNNSLQFGAVLFQRVKNLHLENISVRWMNGVGVIISNVEGLTVQNCEFSDNGGSGMSSHYVTNALIEDSTFARNNWRGIWGGFAKFAIAGLKIHYWDNGILRSNEFLDNDSDGLWIDLQNQRLLVENNVIRGNLRFGLFFEVNWGGCIIRSNVIERNGGGLIIKGSYGGLIENNTFDDQGIAVFQENRRFVGDRNIAPLTAWDNQPKDWIIRGNKFSIRNIPEEDYPRQIEYGIPKWFAIRVSRDQEVGQPLKMIHAHPQQYDFLKTLTWEDNEVTTEGDVEPLYTSYLNQEADFATWSAELKKIKSGVITASTPSSSGERVLQLSAAERKLEWDFDDTDQDYLANWKLRTRDSGFERDKAGNRFLELEKGSVETRIVLQPEVAAVRMSGRIRAENVDGIDQLKPWKQPNIRIVWRDGNDQKIEPPYGWQALDYNSSDWVSFSEVYNVPDGAESMIVSVGYTGDPAPVGFDDISVEAVEFAGMEQME